MSLVGTAERAIAAATGTGWVRIALRLAPFVVIAVLAVALAATRATLDHVRLAARAQSAEAASAAAQAHAADTQRVADAANAFAARTAALQPLVVRSTNTVDHYAQTPAGRSPCLDPGRVRGLDELDAALAAPGPAPNGAAALPADAGAPPAGR